MMKIILISSLFLCLANTIFAQAFSFNHENCQIRIARRSYYADSLKDIYREELEKKNFKIQYLIDDRKAFKGDLYSNLTIKRSGEKLYQDCVVKVSIKEAKSRFIGPSDKTLYEKEVTRRYPRLTMKGNERCRFAIKDAFVHIPTCKEN